MNPKKELPEEEVGPGPDLGSEESADVFQTKEEAQETDEKQRDDLRDEDIISLDSSDWPDNLV